MHSYLIPWLLFFQGVSTQYVLDRRLGGSQSRSGRGDKEEQSHH